MFSKLKCRLNLARLLFASAPLLFLLLITIGFVPNEALAYSCGSNDQNNNGASECYGVTYWSGFTIGVHTDITPKDELDKFLVPIGGNGLIANEVWLKDEPDQYHKTTGCNNYPWCWVEAGYINYGSDITRWFWADSRPDGSYNFHLLNQVTPTDSERGYTSISIEQNEDSKGNHLDSFNLYFEPDQADDSSWPQSIESTGNAINPNFIIIGQRLGGLGQATAPTAEFTYNEWLDSQKNYHYQTTNNGGYYIGPYSQSNAYWISDNHGLESPDSNPYGGEWFTHFP